MYAMLHGDIFERHIFRAYLWRPMKRNIVLMLYLIALPLASTAAELRPKTSTAFDKYVAATEARIESELHPGGTFLYVDGLPTDALKRSYDKLKNGEVLVERQQTKAPELSSEVPDG